MRVLRFALGFAFYCFGIVMMANLLQFLFSRHFGQSFEWIMPSLFGVEVAFLLVVAALGITLIFGYVSGLAK